MTAVSPPPAQRQPQWTGELHVVTGLPCSGKSTLSRALAAALGGSALIVGDLIRAARAASAEVFNSTQAAFDGLEEYSTDWLARLVSSALSGARRPVVLDGAVPLDLALAVLGVEATSVILVHTSETTRRSRFARRRADGSRADDVADRFERRTRMHAASLHRVLRLAPRDRVFSLDGDHQEPDVLRQGLSAVVLARHGVARPASTEVEWPDTARFGDRVSELVSTAGAGACVVTAHTTATPSDPARRQDPLLLFKPGHELRPALLDAVLSRFIAAGCRPTGLAVWPGPSLATSGAVRAHLELHYLLARWSSSTITGHGDLLPAYDLLDAGWSAESLSTWWHDAPKPVRLARALWGKPAAGGRTVVNGHVPAIVSEWERPSSVAVAMRLTRRPDSLSWRELRRDVLGHSDPATASAFSLRGMAHRGLLATSEPINLSANLLHLSAGPFEARRERWIWLGGGGQEAGGDLIDFPYENGWRFEATEHLDVDALR